MSARRCAVAGAIVAATLAAGACGGSGRRGGPPATVPGMSTTSTVPRWSGQPPPALRAVEVARVEQPVALATRTGDSALYVAEKTGAVRVVRAGRVDPKPLVDLRRVVSSGAEQGLLGLVFAPDGSHLYVDYTDKAGDTHVVEYAADGTARREVLGQDQPYANHNGGHVAFGPDGLLYVGFGDGGAAGDPHGNGQRLDTKLGKILRIDPRPSPSMPYTVPPGNPFVDRKGADGSVWAFGLRNPWRFSFDRATGDLWIGDVGQGAFEEIDRAPASSRGGENYGWSRREARHAFRGGTAPAGAVDPVYEYPLGHGACAVVGGYVYRGRAIPALTGRYVFGDNCRAALQVLDPATNAVAPLGLSIGSLSSLGEDGDGELYALSLDGSVSRLEPATAAPAAGAVATTPPQPPTPEVAAAQAVEAERVIRSPSASPADVARAGERAQLAYRAVAARPEWRAPALASTPADLRATVAANLDAQAELFALTKPRTELPPWHVVAPAPPDELLADYHGAERDLGVPWAYLAAIHLVETRMGRIRGPSSAGAQGPMQFLPATWKQYGAGGDIEDNRDAIFAAARLLRHNGAPDRMDDALYSYNHSAHYVHAVTAYARQMEQDERAYRGYHAWQVFYRLATGDVLLPVGWSKG